MAKRATQGGSPGPVFAPALSERRQTRNWLGNAYCKKCERLAVRPHCSYRNPVRLDQNPQRLVSQSLCQRSNANRRPEGIADNDRTIGDKLVAPASSATRSATPSGHMERTLQSGLANSTRAAVPGSKFGLNQRVTSTSWV